MDLSKLKILPIGQEVAVHIAGQNIRVGNVSGVRITSSVSARNIILLTDENASTKMEYLVLFPSTGTSESDWFDSNHVHTDISTISFLQRLNKSGKGAT